MMTGLTIQKVAERTGVSVHTLRAWERRYSVPQPSRMPGNRYRVYDDQDVADVLWMKHQIEAGLAPAQASLLFQQQRRAGAVQFAGPVQPVDATQTALMEALQDSDEATAHQILDQAFALFAPEQVVLQVIQPTMHEIGERWMRNEMTVWQEHLASNVVRQKLVAVLQAQPMLATSAPYLIAACAPAEEHELGLLILTLLARRNGWRTAYLGQGTPLADLADLARSSRPDVIVISVTTVIGLTGLIPWLVEENRPDSALAFGGRIPNLLPSLREHLPGTFPGQDALSAVRNLDQGTLHTGYWSPSKRSWNAVQALQAQRLKIAGEAAMQFMSGLRPGTQRTWTAHDVNHATLFLVDALSSALAFDVPELMDLERGWLKAAMPPRNVSPQLIAQHLETFAHILDNVLADQARIFKPLLERMANHSQA